MLRRDRWVMLVLTGAMVGWWALGLVVTDAASEPYPALMMPGFNGNGGYTQMVFDRYRVAVEARGDDGVWTLHEGADLIVSSMGYVRGMRLFDRALSLDYRTAPPTVREPDGNSVRWLLERVANREGVGRDGVQRMRAVVLRDRFDVSKEPPLIATERVEESLIYKREGAVP